MFPKHKRITAGDFKRKPAEVIRVHGEHLFLYAWQSPQGKNNRYAVVVSKRVARKATQRNKIKRRIFHILRKIDREIPQKGWFFVIHPKKEMSFKTLQNEIEKLYDQFTQSTELSTVLHK